MEVVFEWDVSLSISADVCPLFQQRQCIPATSINPPISSPITPSIQVSFSEQHGLTPAQFKTTQLVTMSGWNSWPGSRGAWQGRPRGYRGPYDDTFIGRRGAMENNWNPYARFGTNSPADYARDYYGDSWSARAGGGRHAAMQQQFMDLQPGLQYNSRLPKGFF